MLTRVFQNQDSHPDAKLELARLKEISALPPVTSDVFREKLKCFMRAWQSRHLKRCWESGISIDKWRVELDLIDQAFQDVFGDKRVWESAASMIRTRNQKANRLSSLPISPTLDQVLRDMRPAGAQGRLFSGRGAARLTVGYVSHQFKVAARAAGIMDVSLHTLRKTFGGWLALSGVDLRSIQALLGHSSIVLTERYYAALQTSNLHGIVAMIAPVTGSLPQLTAGAPPDARFGVQRSVTTLKM